MSKQDPADQGKSASAAFHMTSSKMAPCHRDVPIVAVPTTLHLGNAWQRLWHASPPGFQTTTAVGLGKPGQGVRWAASECHDTTVGRKHFNPINTEHRTRTSARVWHVPAANQAAERVPQAALSVVQEAAQKLPGPGLADSSLRSHWHGPNSVPPKPRTQRYCHLNAAAAVAAVAAGPARAPPV